MKHRYRPNWSKDDITKSPRAKTILPKPEILCDGQKRAVSDSAKYLGEWIDENLKFDVHINSVEREIACAIGLISKLSGIFLRNNAATLPCSH